MITEKIFLLLALAAAFYHIGVDIVIQKETYPAWRLLSHGDFRKVRGHYEKNLFLFFFLPGIIEIFCLLGLLALYEVERLLIYISLAIITANYISSALFWGQWQKHVTNEDLPPESKLVLKIINTNWIRTLLIIFNGIILLALNI